MCFLPHLYKRLLVLFFSLSWWRDWTFSLDCSPFHWSVSESIPTLPSSVTYGWWISRTPRHTSTRPRGKINVGHKKSWHHDDIILQFILSIQSISRSFLIQRVEHDEIVLTLKLKYSRETAGTNNFLTLSTFKYSWHDWQQWATQHNSSKNYDSALIMHVRQYHTHS